MPAAGTPQAKGLHQFVANQFAVYSHMPPGAPIAQNPPDFDTLIDFHQALSSLNSYPDLLRALGLVFDFELPTSFVATTPINVPERLSVVDMPNHAWAIPTQVPPNTAPLETAYLYFSVGDPSKPWQLFTTAPGLLGGGLSTELEVFGLLNLDPTRFGLAQVDRGKRDAQDLSTGRKLAGESPGTRTFPIIRKSSMRRPPCPLCARGAFPCSPMGAP